MPSWGPSASPLLRRINGREFVSRIQISIAKALKEAGTKSIDASDIALAPPPPAHADAADLCVGCFAFAKDLGRSPNDVAAMVSKHLESSLVDHAAAAGPYVNLRLHTGEAARASVSDVLASPSDTDVARDSGIEHRVLEFSSPNTNKPQHLGHVRNNLLGDSVRRLWLASGHRVTAVNLINDRGIHICKSMVAYRHWGEEGTPKSTQSKGDHFVGRFYTLFETRFQQEYAAWLASEASEPHWEAWKASPQGTRTINKLGEKKNKKKQKKEGPDASTSTEAVPEEEVLKAFSSAHKDVYFNGPSALGLECRTMLSQWEEGEQAQPQVWALWRRLNGWVLGGFDQTYSRYGVAFDHIDYESEMYLKGKAQVEAAVSRGVLRVDDTGAVVWDVPEDVHSGEKKGKKRKQDADNAKGVTKVLLRADGTSVYMTQDVGTAIDRFDRFAPDHMSYVVADEQDRHFRILFALLGKVQERLEGRLHHMSYGLVHLPSGRMKSREGTVVDADDLLNEATQLAAQATQAKWPQLSEDEVALRADRIGLAALKFFVLIHSPSASFVYDAVRALDFSGRTGPYCMYTYARTRSILRKAGLIEEGSVSAVSGTPAPSFEVRCGSLQRLSTKEERAVVMQLMGLPAAMQMAADNNDPAKVATAVYDLSRSFNAMYFDREQHSIANCSDEELRTARLLLVEAVGAGIQQGLGVLGIETLEEM